MSNELVAAPPNLAMMAMMMKTLATMIMTMMVVMVIMMMVFVMAVVVVIAMMIMITSIKSKDSPQNSVTLHLARQFDNFKTYNSGKARKKPFLQGIHSSICQFQQQNAKKRVCVYTKNKHRRAFFQQCRGSWNLLDNQLSFFKNHFPSLEDLITSFRSS